MTSNDKEGKMEQYGVRHGYVASVGPDFYRVVLNTVEGLRHYQFPKSICPVRLKPEDQVKCFLVKQGDDIEPRLERLPKRQPTPEQESKLEELSRQRLEELDKKYGVLE